MHPFSANSPLHQISNTPAWAHAGEDSSAVILSTRVRIARNLAGEVFPARMNSENRIRVLRTLSHLFASLPESNDALFLSLSTLTPLEIGLLVERRAVSPQLARDENPRGVFVWKNSDRALMVCEEDHLHFTEIVPGSAPKQAYGNLLPVLENLSKHVQFAAHDDLGFLTACPANVGAAVRTSLFCHLPGLIMTGGIASLISHVTDAGFTVRGFWGEQSEALGNIFQLTDGPNLSHPVQDTMSRIENVGQEVIEREALARIDLQSSRPHLLKDKIARALAILQSCRALTGAETLFLHSAVRLGLDIGFIDHLKRETISLLTFELGRSYLQWTHANTEQEDARQSLRADLAREAFREARFVA